MFRYFIHGIRVIFILIAITSLFSCNKSASPENSIKKNTDKTDLFNTAVACYEEAAYDSSLSILNTLCPIFHDNEDWEKYLRCHVYMAKCYLKKGQYDNGLASLNELFPEIINKLDKSNSCLASLYNARGDMYRKIGDLKSASENYQYGLTNLNPNLKENQFEIANSLYGIGVLFYYEGKFDSSISYHQKALNMRSQIFGESHPLIAESYVNLGLIYSKIGDFDKAQYYHENALEVRLNALRKDHPDVANSYLNLGVLCYQRADYEKAIDYYQKSIRIITAKFGEQHPSLAGNYLNLGVIYDKQGDYNRSLEYYQKSLLITEKSIGKKHPLIAINYNNIGIVYKKTNQFDMALEYYRKAIDTYLEIIGENNPDVMQTYLNVGNVYSLQKKFEESVSYYLKALEIGEKIFRNMHPLSATIYNNLGTSYLDQKKYQKAMDCLNKSIDIATEIFENKHPLISEIWQQMGNIFVEKQDYQKALHYYQQSLIALIPTFSNIDFFANPESCNIIEKIRLISVLKSKANALNMYYRFEDKNIEILECALSTCQLAIDLIDQTRNSHQTEEAKLFLGESTYDIYKETIEFAYKLYEDTGDIKYQNIVFQYIEKSKSNTLRQVIYDSRAKQFADIPDSIITVEDAINRDVFFYNNLILNEEDSSKISVWKNKLFQLNRQHEYLIDRIEIKYPEYFKLRYDSYVCSVPDIQEEIVDENTSLIEYFVSDTCIFIYLIAGEKSFIKRVSIENDFSQNIELLLSAIKNREYGNYLRTAYDLYKILLQPIENEIEKKNLIIIQDGSLGYIPFEALITERANMEVEDYKNLSYLLTKNQVSYHYSATLLIENKKHSNEKLKYNFTGFAPIKFR